MPRLNTSERATQNALHQPASRELIRCVRRLKIPRSNASSARTKALKSIQGIILSRIQLGTNASAESNIAQSLQDRRKRPLTPGARGPLTRLATLGTLSRKGRGLVIQLLSLSSS